MAHSPYPHGTTPCIRASAWTGSRSTRAMHQTRPSISASVFLQIGTCFLT
ncbi:MAG: hypothetical protein LV479_12245 [Methylacidiphilales bacterium]|nr:hypothetical protein [Candidatus Methylacidiphilales bacterium]